MIQKLINLEEYKEIQTEAEQVVQDYYEIDSQIKVLEKRKKELAEQLKDNKPGNYKIGNYITEIIEMPGRKTIDKKEIEYFLEDHGKSLTQFEKEGKSFKKLSIKRLN